MMKKQAFLCGWLFALFGLCVSVSAQTKSVSEQFADVQALIQGAREVDAEVTISSLINQLQETKSAISRKALLDGLIDLARESSSYPTYIKAHIQRQLPPVALSLARNTSLDWTLRGTALMALRNISANKTELEQAILIAQTDQSKEKDFIASRGLLLKVYLEGLLKGGITQVEIATTGDRTKERAAIAFLRTRGLKPTYDQLTSSLLDLEPEEVAALFDANTLSQQRRQANEGLSLWSALSSGCHSSKHRLEHASDLVGLLHKQGLDINARDDLNNSPLLLAAQYCPVEVIQAMVNNGAKLNVFNTQKVSELSMAIVSNNWDAVAFLVEKGSRLPKKAIEELFLELPDNPSKLAILKKAESKP
jgi:hypothetical protein